MNKVLKDYIDYIKNFKKLPKQLQIKIVGGISIAIVAVITLFSATSGYSGPDFYKYKKLQDKELYCLGCLSQIIDSGRSEMSSQDYWTAKNTISAAIFMYFEYYHGIKLEVNDDGSAFEGMSRRDKKILNAYGASGPYYLKKIDKEGYCDDLGKVPNSQLKHPTECLQKFMESSQELRNITAECRQITNDFREKVISEYQ